MAFSKKVEGEVALANSMTDLMTSLAVVFILLLVAYLNQAYMENKRRTERYKQLISHSRTIKSDLTRKLQQIGLDATDDPQDPLAIVIPISETRLQFDQAKSDLKPAGKDTLRSFVPELAEVICSPSFQDDVESVLIEGHTNSDGKEEQNLRLSQDRSYNVLRCVLNECGLKGRQRDLLLDKISANGRGQRHPVLNKAGREDHDASRRVVFKIRMKSVEEKHVLIG